jgi:RimJ/RimL family protein N-acetyltransferase
MTTAAPAVRLRGLIAADLPRLYTWYQDKGLVDGLVGGFRFRSEAEALRHMEAWLQSSSQEARLAVVRADDGALLGLTALTSIDTVNRCAELHLFIGAPETRRRGYGRAATLALLAHGFGDLGLHRIELRVLADNAPARALYHACGFVEEGIKRDAAFKNGRFVDVVLMATLAPPSA